jgi:hypothetical protein
MTFEGLARAVDRLACALDSNADLLQAIAENMDHFHEQARDRAERNRRLADALREAARSLAAHEVPRREVREIIRES